MDLFKVGQNFPSKGVNIEKRFQRKLSKNIELFVSDVLYLFSNFFELLVQPFGLLAFESPKAILEFLILDQAQKSIAMVDHVLANLF